MKRALFSLAIAALICVGLYSFQGDVEATVARQQSLHDQARMQSKCCDRAYARAWLHIAEDHLNARQLGYYDALMDEVGTDRYSTWNYGAIAASARNDCLVATQQEREAQDGQYMTNEMAWQRLKFDDPRVTRLASLYTQVHDVAAATLDDDVPIDESQLRDLGFLVTALIQDLDHVRGTSLEEAHEPYWDQP